MRIRPRAAWAIVVSALALVGLTVGVSLDDSSTSALAAPSSAKLQSIAMTTAPVVEYDRAQPSYPAGAAARAAATEAALRVPLPRGGNLNGIQWERAQGTLAASEAEGVVEYNAFCQWLRAARDNRDRDLALSVLDDVPQWPAFRQQDARSLLFKAVTEAHAGAGDMLEQVLTDCDVSHEREIAYASSLRLPPSS